MDTMLLRMFQKQILQQATYVEIAATDLVASGNVDERRVWYSIECLLMAAANVSKALWGSGGKLGTERKELRDSLGVSDDSPLRDCVVRNHFEHYDARLDEWWEKSEHHNHVDLNLGVDYGRAEIDTFRSYYPPSADVTFWGDRFNLKVIVDEVRKMGPLLKAEVAKPPW